LPNKSFIIKHKYHAKTLSDNAIYLTWQRLLDISPLYAENVWLQLLPFDLAELGFSLQFVILPRDFEPLNLNFEVSLPSYEILNKGINMEFEKVDFSDIYSYLKNFEEYKPTNFLPEYQPQLPQKAIYGQSLYDFSFYDPVISREYIRATLERIRTDKTLNLSVKKAYKTVSENFDISLEVVKHIYNRLMLIFSAQINSFVIGLSVLGKSILSEIEGGLAKVPFVDYDDKIMDVKFKTLEHLQFGFLLGITPLGYGFLLPKICIYKLVDGKKSPEVLRLVFEKHRNFINRLITATWSYTRYVRPQEFKDYHQSDNTGQYDAIQQIRRHIESWVENQIPSEEANAVKVRQYQNAVLQAIAYRVKRHRWGFTSYKVMREDEFKSWWKDYWKGQGLNPSLLDSLYEGMLIWLQDIRREKWKLGEKVKQMRLRAIL